ncbi:hypothetical protein LguiA_001555 [Lonicera macranthoides]
MYAYIYIYIEREREREGETSFVILPLNGVKANNIQDGKKILIPVLSIDNDKKLYSSSI